MHGAEDFGTFGGQVLAIAVKLAEAVVAHLMRVEEIGRQNSGGAAGVDAMVHNGDPHRGGKAHGGIRRAVVNDCDIIAGIARAQILDGGLNGFLFIIGHNGDEGLHARISPGFAGRASYFFRNTAEKQKGINSRPGVSTWSSFRNSNRSPKRAR